MKKLLGTLFIVFITATSGIAQPDGQPSERIHAAKMAYVTDRIHLSSEQSVNFVPLYNEYEKELRNIRHTFNKKHTGSEHISMSDAASRKYVDDDLDYQQQVLDLKRRYNDRFLTVLSPQQLADLYKAEREFRQMLMKRLDQQHRPGFGRFR
jgi:hypothetical protein